MTQEEFIDMECAESGKTLEMEFDIETEQDRLYSLYIDEFEKVQI